jgi:hypothetical protein
MPTTRGLRLALPALLVAVAAHAQSPPPAGERRSPDPLLAELRLLRQASDRQARIDLLVARALLQQGRVSRAQLQVGRFEEELWSLSRERARLRTTEAEYERSVGLEIDSSRRHSLDLALQAVQAQRKQYEEMAGDLQRELLEAKQGLDAEAQRVEALARQLDLLERELQRARPE